MNSSKFGKYIITELKYGSRGTPPRPVSPEDIAAMQSHSPVLNLDDEILKGAFYVESVWIWPGPNFYPTWAEPKAHSHDFNEVITFFGTKFEDPHDLCGEIELWLEDEQHILTKSCMVFVPKGMKHCPLVIRKVNRPIFHFSVGTGESYIQG
jgi:hypothetical protein